MLVRLPQPAKEFRVSTERLHRSLVLAVLVALAAPARPADACMNGVERVVDRTNQAVRDAESLLAAGKLQQAANLVLATFPAALELDHKDRKQSLFERAQRVLAVAVVRGQGAVKLGKALPGKSAAQRDLGLAWAAGALRYHQARGLGGIVLTAELAEALALRPAEATEAHDILKDLADRDLMPTARAWAILASLEKDRGDADASARAVARCKEISPDAAQCEVVTNT
jgi:hypothetical protein